MADDDEWVNKILVIGSWINIGTYSIVLGLSLHNALKFLVIQGRWKNFYLMGFYTLTVLVALARILYFYSEYRGIMAETYDPVWTRNTFIYYYCNGIALSSKAALGIFQIGSMIELAIHVKLSAEKMDLERAQTQKNWTKIMVCVVSLPLIPLGVLQGKIDRGIVFD